MKPSDFQKTVQCRFDCCLKKVVRGVLCDYRKELKRRKSKETLFCELPDIIIEKLAIWDKYDCNYTIFNVCGNDIRVFDDELAEALEQLSERNRDNLLMYYFLDMSDTEIAKIQNISRSGVFQNRHHALELIKNSLKEE
ncbi:RNA polymerase sigma factor [Candidatus Stoquefichus massiliensis]|uniref:RNA polymerase sigma factor n=1 Tax=Candidatus Stoquefichus massiliensis TaxID=1470350 RepID=UPI0004800723|nr:sigma factor-like helix-turn-helix DNA-binding protein [Candidatus Stoquefichus massiliensis]